MEDTHIEPIKFFGRRKGRPIRPRRQELLDGLLPRLVLPGPPFQDIPDPRLLFGPPGAVRDVWLEVGFGGGEHLAAQAAAYPDIGIIGAEPFQNGVASLLDKIDRQDLPHIRILPNDVRPLLPHLPDGCLGRCFVMFPDPWPKTRHVERRFLGGENLDQLVRLLRPGGELRAASDEPILVPWMDAQLRCHADLTPIGPGRFNQHPTSDWPTTRYESKALAAGRAPSYWLYKRK
ncbi:MAG: tRNA (guanosine(46)-N7)-methyltransferase TrmB [Alphaproteobacteria bacterium]|nr:MAG: tRNA (guanosine(46)-N7)-methyltransferase TrmB [Alphaproteobacteria bacterium]